jgi:hypothetical protein
LPNFTSGRRWSSEMLRKIPALKAFAIPIIVWFFPMSLGYVLFYSFNGSIPKMNENIKINIARVILYSIRL